LIFANKYIRAARSNAALARDLITHARGVLAIQKHCGLALNDRFNAFSVLYLIAFARSRQAIKKDIRTAHEYGPRRSLFMEHRVALSRRRLAHGLALVSSLRGSSALHL
jgi:hypothetical protein